MFEWILHIIETGGYAGVFFLMVLENLFPPIPSELVIPLAGFAAADGSLNIIGVIAAATFGAVVGCLPWYILGRLFGVRRMKQLASKYGRVLTLAPDDIDHAQEWFNRHGHIAVFFGRLVPTVRTLISVPAGIARMPLIPFLAYTFLGSAIWTTTLAFLGFVLESHYDQIGGYVDVVSNGVVLLIVFIYICRVIRFQPVDKRVRKNTR